MEHVKLELAMIVPSFSHVDLEMGTVSKAESKVENVLFYHKRPNIT